MNVLLCRFGSVCNRFRNGWIHHLPCGSMWSDRIASNFWNCWAHGCFKFIRESGTIVFYAYMFCWLWIFNPVYSQDKLGPFCRSAADCAIVLDAIRGQDPDDLSSRNIPFSDPFDVDITKLTVGYLEDAEMDVSELVLF